jgi:hypothetical protein
MALKGASFEHEGLPKPDRWGLDEQLTALASRWDIDPRNDLGKADTMVGASEG